MNSWIRKIWKENKFFVILFFLMICFRSALADWNTVPTGSMKPTIIEGDRVWVNKLAYDFRIPLTGISLHRFSNPKRGDIVTVDSNSAGVTLIKRIIGLPGDTVEMVNNRLFINGKSAKYSIMVHDINGSLVEEDLNGMKHMIRLAGYRTEYSSFPPVIVPKNKYLVLGDNRDDSADSRVHGFIPRSEIRGRSNLVIMSLNYENFYIPRTTRFFKELL
jgi:signal peptidase I